MVENLKTALVTGGARRVGKAIVSDLSAAGFAVAIHYRGSDREASDLVKNLKDRGGKVAIVHADLTDREATARLIGEATDAIGPIGLLVNNASVFNPDGLDDFTWEHWDRHFAVHLPSEGAGGSRPPFRQRPARRRERAGCQHDRPARLETHAANL
jgi:NAD(P)-dependent dehydrogenase (short-subunit alcohol dehydrogenase family)